MKMKKIMMVLAVALPLLFASCKPQPTYAINIPHSVVEATVDTRYQEILAWLLDQTSGNANILEYLDDIARRYGPDAMRNVLEGIDLAMQTVVAPTVEEILTPQLVAARNVITVLNWYQVLYRGVVRYGRIAIWVAIPFTLQYGPEILNWLGRFLGYV
jgi:hypothetical protein